MKSLKVLVAPDSFKGSLSAQAAAEAIKLGLLQGWPELKITTLPIADGGEGTAEVLVHALDGTWREVSGVKDPLERPLLGRYGLVGTKAFLDVAQASGLHHLVSAQRDERDPWRATSYGTGQLLVDALHESKARQIVIGLGGSATVDGGIGLLQALGGKLLDAQGNPVGPGGQGLAQVHTVELGAIRERLKDIELTVACDVLSPLLGAEGAAYLYGPQKGATAKIVEDLERGMMHYADILEKTTGETYRKRTGAGAAGGLGFAFHALGASFRPGVEIVLETLDFKQKASAADLVISGEGMTDGQTLQGKAIMGILKDCYEVQTPVILLAGSVRLDPSIRQLLKSGDSAWGATALLDSVPRLMALPEVLEQAALHLQWSAEQTSRLLRLGGSLCGS
jgi:glycerate 2-kinase